MDLNENGVLEPGLHRCTLDEVYDTFVNKFSTSIRRKNIFKSLIAFLKKLNDNYKIYEVWIDGSYVSEKINPNDVDTVIFFEVDDFIKVSTIWNNIRAVQDIDSYCAVAVNEDSKKRIDPTSYQQIVNNRNYWRGQFGYDRADKPKGIIVLPVEEIEKYLKGGETDVNGGN